MFDKIKRTGCLRVAYEINRGTRIFHEFAFNNKALKTFLEF